MQKLIRKHQWITKPDSKGISYFGLTQFAKDYFLRMDSVNHQQFKTSYGIKRRYFIEGWLNNVRDKYRLGSMGSVFQNMEKLSLAEQMQFNRFCIRQDQPFSQLNTLQFNVQLTAPIAMRVLQYNFDADYFGKANVYKAEWLYKVELLDSDMSNLLTQEQYERSNKIIESQGMLF